MKSSGLPGWALNPMTAVLVKVRQRGGRRGRLRKEHREKAMSVWRQRPIHLQTKDPQMIHQEPPEMRRGKE